MDQVERVSCPTLTPRPPSPGPLLLASTPLPWLFPRNPFQPEPPSDHNLTLPPPTHPTLIMLSLEPTQNRTQCSALCALPPPHSVPNPYTPP